MNECGLRTIGILDTKPGKNFVDSYFDEDVELVGKIPCTCNETEVSATLYRCEGRPIVVASLVGAVPDTWRRVTVTFTGAEYRNPVMVDLADGVIYDIEELNVSSHRQFWSDYKNAFTRIHDLPLRGSSVMIVDRVLVPSAFDWAKM
ncbi:MAG: hypothetical protein IJS19_07015, partial [Muribaculaceae bacterium]|nr:hypothetical protein [Muribaculaceae bacterium]